MLLGREITRMRKNYFQPLAVLLVVVAIAAAAYLYLRRIPPTQSGLASGPVAAETHAVENPTPPPLGTKPPLPLKPVSSSTNRPTTPAQRAASLGSLPSLDNPLAPQMHALEERARNGDTTAAIALWHGLQQCARLTNGGAEAELKLAKQGYDNSKATPPDPSGEIRALLANCENVTGAQMDQRYGWLKSAAQAGDPQAQFLYAQSGPDAIGGTEEALRDPQKWEEYREEAISYMDDLTKQCYLNAITDMASSYYFGNAYYPKDAVKAYMFRLLVTQLGDKPMPAAAKDQYLQQASSKLSSEQIAAATQLANNFQQQYCQ